jgi:hypothetical protein
MDLDTTAPSSAGHSLRVRGKGCAQGLKRTNCTPTVRIPRPPSSLKGFKNRTDRGKLAFNKQMSSLRISVEWAFAYIGKKLPLVLNAKHNRMQQTSIAAEMYAAVIVSNAISCLEPNQISQYFRCAPPAVEDYLHDDLSRTPEEYLDASARCLASDIDR